jgi:hypothetical protein
MNKVMFLFFFMVGLISFCIIIEQIIPESDFELEQKEAALYCEMVAEYKRTGGQYGWPDYNKTFDKYCEVKK